MEQAKESIKGFKSQVEKAKKNVDDNIKKMGEGISKTFKKVITATAAAGTALLALGASTAEYRAEQAKLKTAFETAGASAEQAKETYNGLYRVLGDTGQATEAANHLAKLTTNQQELSEWTTICQGVYATFGDSLPIEGLTEAANETAKTGELTGSLADALNWAGVSEDAFSEQLANCNTEAEREALIRETLSGLYTDAAKKYEENAASVLAQNEAQAKLTDTMATLGEIVQPVVSLFISFAADALAAVIPYIQDLVENWLPVLQEILGFVADVLSSTLNFVIQHKTLLKTIAVVIGVITTAIGAYNAVAAIKLAMDAAQTATLGGLIAAKLADAAATIAALAPYIAIVAAIAAVIAIIVVCVKHWDEIKNACAKAWNTIKEKTTQAVEAVKNKFNEMKQKVSEKISAIKETVSEKFNAVKETMKNTIENAKNAVQQKLNSMKQTFNEHGGGIKGIAATAMEGVKNCFTSGYGFINNLTGGKLGEVVNQFKSKFNGIREIAANSLETVKNKFSSMIESAKNIVGNGLQRIRNFFNFKWELPKIKLPHFSITGRFSLNPPSIPHFSIQWYKNGGIFDNPTLFPYGNGRIGGLGEDGAEAIVPLEKNTKWLDRIASMLNEKQGGNQPIYLMVDGRVFGEVACNSINDLTRMRGSIPLVFK